MKKIYVECPNCGHDISVELAEHDRQIRAEVIDEVLKKISEVIPFLNNDQLQAYFNICDKICWLKEQK